MRHCYLGAKREYESAIFFVEGGHTYMIIINIINQDM